METTPNDLRQQQFEIKFRGYNADDVEVFRELAATALEESRTEVLRLSEENKHLKERLKHLLDLEDTLKAAVLEAQKNADMTIAAARKEAESMISGAERERALIVHDAQTQRDEIVSDMHRRMGKLVNDISKLRFIRSNYLVKLRHLIAAQSDLVEEALREESAVEQPSDQPSASLEGSPRSQAASGDSADMREKTVDQIAVPFPEETEEDRRRQASNAPSDNAPEDDEWKHLKEHLSEE